MHTAHSRLKSSQLIWQDVYVACVLRSVPAGSRWTLCPLCDAAPIDVHSDATQNAFHIQYDTGDKLTCTGRSSNIERVWQEQTRPITSSFCVLHRVSVPQECACSGKVQGHVRSAVSLAVGGQPPVSRRGKSATHNLTSCVFVRSGAGHQRGHFSTEAP